MNRLYVLYDANCGLCSTVHEWVEQQPQLIPMEFITANSPRACQLFPALTRLGARPEELIVVDLRGTCHVPPRQNSGHSTTFQLELASTFVANSQVLPFTSLDCSAFNDLMIRGLPPSAGVMPSAINFGLGVIYSIAGIVLVRRRFG